MSTISNENGDHPQPSSEYNIVASDNYDQDRNVKYGWMCFLAVSAILVALTITELATDNAAKPVSYKQIDVPDYVWGVCTGGEDDNYNNDSDITCYQAGAYHDCSCECYGFSWGDDEDPKITDRFCRDDDDGNDDINNR